jgi:hypothetical protein
MYIGSGVFNDSTTESNVQLSVPNAGTISNLSIKLSADPGTTGVDTWRFTVRKNGVATTITCDVVADGTTCTDVAHSDATWVAGDLISIQALPVNTPSVEPTVYWSVKFQ